MKKNNYYIYFHINPIKNEVFYVGKGIRCRAKVKKGRSKLWENVSNKYGYTISYPHKNISEKEAFKLETYYISKFGRMDLGNGCLVNLTDGGEGCSGHIFTQEHKDNIGKSMKGRIFSEEHIKRNIASKLGKKRPKEFCKKMSEINKGKKLTQEHRNKLSEVGIGRIHSEETKNKIKSSNIISSKLRQKSVIQLDLENNIIKKYKSISEAALKTKLDKSRISKCCNREAITTGGFKWEFKYL